MSCGSPARPNHARVVRIVAVIATLGFRLQIQSDVQADFQNGDILEAQKGQAVQNLTC